jgi:hypothetical protein
VESADVAAHAASVPLRPRAAAAARRARSFRPPAVGQQTGDGEGNVGPAEDIEKDPAHEPDEEGLKDLKGG